MLRAVIFDFDGVIADSELLHFKAFNSVLCQFGIEISKGDYYKDYLGLTDYDVFGVMIESGRLGESAAAVDDLVERKNRIFEELSGAGEIIIEGVREFLEMLRGCDVSMAICSGALHREIESILVQANIGHYFEAIVSAEEVQKGKPDPEGFLLAMERLGKKMNEPVIPGQCVVIEDSHWGLEAGRAAGMRTVAVTNSYDAGELGMADKVVGRLDELTMDELYRLCAYG